MPIRMLGSSRGREFCARVDESGSSISDFYSLDPVESSPDYLLPIRAARGDVGFPSIALIESIKGKLAMVASRQK